MFTLIFSCNFSINNNLAFSFHDNPFHIRVPWYRNVVWFGHKLTPLVSYFNKISNTFQSNIEERCAVFDHLTDRAHFDIFTGARNIEAELAKKKKERMSAKAAAFKNTKDQRNAFKEKLEAQNPKP